MHGNETAEVRLACCCGCPQSRHPFLARVCARRVCVCVSVCLCVCLCLCHVFQSAVALHSLLTSKLPMHRAVAEPSALPFARLTLLAPGQQLVRAFSAQLPADPNGLVEQLYQVGPDTCSVRSLAMLVSHIMFDKMFDRLRTSEQLGYSVNCYHTSLCGVVHYSLRIQSAKYTVGHVHKRISWFVEWFRGFLDELTEDTLAKFVDALVETKLQPDARMSAETNRHWGEITSRRYDFEYLVEEVAALRAVTKPALLSFYDSVFTAPTARSLSVWVKRTQAEDDSEFDPSWVDASSDAAVEALHGDADWFQRAPVDALAGRAASDA